MIELQLDKEDFASGEILNGLVIVREPINCQSIEVALTFHERTADFEEAVAAGGTGPLHQGPLQAAASLPFALTLPPDPLPPYRSRWGELFWLLRAQVTLVGARPIEAARRITIVPDGVEAWQLAGEQADEFVRLMPAKLAEMSAAPDIFGNRPKTVPGPPAPPPTQAEGWYEDPWKEKRLRWWDGRTWTGHTTD